MDEKEKESETKNLVSRLEKVEKILEEMESEKNTIIQIQKEINKERNQIRNEYQDIENQLMNVKQIYREYLEKEEYKNIEIKYNNSFKTIIKGRKGINILAMKARIHYTHEAGSQYLLRIYVNNTVITEDDLINKPKTEIIRDGREFPWYNPTNKSWRIPYSPSFISNYFHERYKVMNGDPYILMFDISHIKKKNGNGYEIVIQHNGMKGNEAYMNSVIIDNLELIFES